MFLYKFIIILLFISVKKHFTDKHQSQTDDTPTTMLAIKGAQEFIDSIMKEKNNENPPVA